MIDWWMLCLLGVLAVYFFGFTNALAVGILYALIDYFGAIVLVLLVVAPLVLIPPLYRIHNSAPKTLRDLIGFWLILTSWLASLFAMVVRKVGRIPFTDLFTRLYNAYLGDGFAKRFRESFVGRGEDYYDQGDVELEKSSEQLAREARALYDDAGRRLSNGEAVFGFSLAVFGILAVDPGGVDLPSVVGAVLSIALVMTVTLRLTALDALMYRDPTADAEVARLRAILSWNQTVVSVRGMVVKIFLYDLMWRLSEEAVDFYMDWVLRESLEGDGPNGRRLISELWKPMRSFITAEMNNLTPSQASRKLYGSDVFASPEFADPNDEQVDASPPE